MRVLLLNQGHTENYGDIAIKETIEKILEMKGIDATTKEFWSSSFIFNNHNFKLCNLLIKILFKIPFLLDYCTKKHFKKIIFDYECVIIGGGELLGNHMGFNSSLNSIVNICDFKNIPVFLIGVSGDSELPKKMLNRYKKSLKKCDYIAVRDTLTFDLLKNEFCIKDVKLYPDIVFSYKKLLNNNDNTFNKNNKKLLCIPIVFSKTLKRKMNFNKIEEYFEYLYNLISKHKYTDIIISSTTSADDNISNQFYFYVLNKDKKLSLDYIPYSNIGNYMKLLEQVDFIVSGRMHALILGILYGCKFDVIPFKNKLIVFKQDYENVFSRDDNLEKIESKVLEMFEDIFNKFDYIEDVRNEK